MRLFKIAGLLGLVKDEEQQHHYGDAAAAETAAPPLFSVPPAAEAIASTQHIQRRGFSVPIKVLVEWGPPAPHLVFFPAGDGGIQVTVRRVTRFLHKKLNMQRSILVIGDTT